MCKQVVYAASLLVVWATSVAGAGVIDLISVEDKGEVTIDIGFWTKEFMSHMTVTLGSEWENPGTYHRDNRETLVWNSVAQVSFHFWNIYPAKIHVPQPPSSSSSIDFFSVIAVGEPGALGPLPDSMQPVSGMMIGATGTGFDETISSVSVLPTDLPTSSANDTSIEWDLTPFAVTGGNFYLFSVTLPYHDLVPEPATAMMLPIGLLIINRRRRK